MAERNVAVRLSAEVSGYIAAMTRAGAATERAMGGAAVATGKHSKILGTLGTVAKYTGVAIAGGFALAVKEAADFNEKMALVQTLSHANAAQMRLLSASAMHTGTAFGYTATQVADGQAEMVKAGISLKDIMGGGLKGALTLAAAGQTSVADATQIAATAMTQFQLKGKDIPHIADLLAAGADKALGSVTDLGFGLGQAGTTAHQMGLSINDTVGTLAEFAQAGQTGEKGGTLLNQMLLRLSAPSKQASERMKALGISIYDANGQMKTMPQIAGTLQHAFQGMSPAARNAALGIIFGTRAIRAANILIADGAKGSRKWINAVNDQGFAARQAGGKLNSLKGDFQKLKAEGVNALIQLGSGAQSPLRHLVQGITSGIHKITTDGSLKHWGNEAASALETVVSAAGPVVSAIGHIVSAFNSLPSGVKKGIAIGGISALVASKIPGVPTVARTAIGATGLGRGGVTPVFVTNPGFGKVGADGLPLIGGVGGKAGAGAHAAEEKGLGALLSRALAPALLLGTRIAPFAFGASSDTKSKGGDPGKQLSTLGRLAGAPQGAQFKEVADATQRWDRALADLAQRHPDRAIAKMQDAARKTGFSFKELAQLFPRTSKAVGDFSRHVNSGSSALAGFGRKTVAANFSQMEFGAHKAGVSTQELARMLHKIPSNVLTQFLTPGAVQSKRDVKALAAQFGLTPKQVKILLKLLGFEDGDKKVKQTKRNVDRLNTSKAKPHVEAQGTGDTDKKVNQNKKNVDRLNTSKAKPHVEVQGTGDTDSKVNHNKANLHALGAISAKPRVSVTDNASGTINNIKREIATIQGKSVTITTTHLSIFRGRSGATPQGAQAADAAGHASGGHIRGPGSETSDSIPALLSDNEYVVRASAVRKYGVSMMHQINAMQFANGGPVRLASGGHVARGSVDIDGSITHFALSIKGVSKELAKLTDLLKRAQENRKQYASATSQAYVQDPFAGTLGGFDSQIAYETKRIRGAREDLTTLRKRGLSGALYKNLAGSGNATIIDQFSHLTKAQIAARERAYNADMHASVAIGNQAADAAYGARIADLTHETTKLRKELHALRHGHHIGNTNIHKATIQDSPTKAAAKKAAQKLRHR